jgi:acid phosphatase (class A)
MVISMKLDDIRYGNPVEESLKDFRRFLKMGINPDILAKLIPPYPPNSSSETREELEYLYELQEEERPYMKRLIARVDKSVSEIFFDMCAEWQLEAYEEEALIVIKTWGALAGILKVFYNRARPYQLAPHHKIPLFPMVSISAWSAAYPSGHTIQAEALARFYGEKYPEIADEFVTLAQSVSHTRLVGGYHFPSDILASEALVELLWGKVL